MNLYVQYRSIIVLCVLLEEVIQLGEAFKAFRPYKYYQRRPWNRYRWHTSPRVPSRYYPSRSPRYNRFADTRFGTSSRYRSTSLKEDLLDRSVENHPYTIVIQLPKSEEKYNRHYYERNYARDSIPVYPRESDYTDDEDDEEYVDAKTFDVGDKRVRIKVIEAENPKVRVKISRVDTENDIEIIDKSNMVARNVSYKPDIDKKLTLSMDPTGEEPTSTKSTTT